MIEKKEGGRKKQVRKNKQEQEEAKTRTQKNKEVRKKKQEQEETRTRTRKKEEKRRNN